MLSITVDTLVDENDGVIGTGVGTSLREAIYTAAPNEVIDFAPQLSGGTINLTEGELLIDSDVEIRALDQNITIDAEGTATNHLRAFNITDGNSTTLINVTIRGLTITGGDVTGHGGGIQNSENLLLDSVVVVDNHADNFGGGLYSQLGTLTIHNSTFQENTAKYGGGVRADLVGNANVEVIGSTFDSNIADDGNGVGSGGGILLQKAGNATILNSTFSGNLAAQYGGGIRSHATGGSGTTEVINSTITNNTGVVQEGGISSVGGAITTVHNSIVAGNFSPGDPTKLDASGAFSSLSSNNLIGTTYVADLNDTQDGNIPGVNNPLFTQLGYRSGPTKTHALLLGSQAIDAGDNQAAIDNSLTSDQRGYNRFVDNTLHTVVEKGKIDIGAFEYTLVIDNPTDEDDGNYTVGDFSLREALKIAKNLEGNNEIVIAQSLTGSTIVLDPTFGELYFDNDVQIIGLGADQLTIQADGTHRVLKIAAGVIVTIEGLTITGGDGTSSGGGIYSAGDLTLESVVVADNRTVGNGGGLYSAAGSLTVKNSTFRDNEAKFAGGLYSKTTTLIENSTFSTNRAVVDAGGSGGTAAGVYFWQDTFTVLNSTFSGNIADNYGGGIRAHGGATVTVVNSTITQNSATLGAAGGIGTSSTSTFTIHNSIVAGNFANTSISIDTNGSFTSDSSFNLIGTTGSNDLKDSSDGNVSGVNSPLLAPLGDYGGLTKTHALQYDSLAIDTASDVIAENYGVLIAQSGISQFPTPEH